MDENRIRQLIKEEIQRNERGSRFGFKNVQQHRHTGKDSPQIRQDDVIPSVSVMGSITMSQEATYTLRLNAAFTPRNILVTGNVVGGNQRYFFIGGAQLTPSFFFQPINDTSVVQGTTQYPFIDPNHPEYGANIPAQWCTYYGQESAGGALHTLVGNFHIIDIQFPLGTSHARATVTDFSKDAITLRVESLDSGWDINANFVVT